MFPKLDYESFEDFKGWPILLATYDEDSIYLKMPSGIVRLFPYGDCCAQCYIQHVSGAEALQNAVVLEWEHCGDERIYDDDGYVVDAWMYKIKTERGWCTIEMRVEHNGYYGGSLEIEKCESTAGSILDDF